MGLDDRSEVARIATRLADAANLYREACDLLDDPELRACFAGRHALRDALSRGLRDGDGAGGDPSRETEHMVRYVRDALVADRGPPERISRTLRKQPG